MPPSRQAPTQAGVGSGVIGKSAVCSPKSDSPTAPGSAAFRRTAAAIACKMASDGCGCERGGTGAIVVVPASPLSDRRGGLFGHSAKQRWLRRRSRCGRLLAGKRLGERQERRGLRPRRRGIERRSAGRGYVRIRLGVEGGRCQGDRRQRRSRRRSDRYGGWALRYGTDRVDLRLSGDGLARLNRTGGCGSREGRRRRRGFRLGC